MKVALDISPALYGTGVSDYVIELVNHLEGGRMDSFQVAKFGYSLRRRQELQNLFPNAKIFPFPPTAMHYLWNKLHVFPVENLTGPIDIYHSSDWAQAPSKAKKVTTIHDLAPFLYSQEHENSIIRVHRARMDWVAKECDAIICVSQNTANDMAKLFPETSSRLVVVPEAMPSRFNLQPTTNNLQPYILAIGARQPRKNIARLISAFLKYRPAEKLIIVGEKPNHLEGGRMDSFQVEFTGYVSDQELVNYLASASCFVYPSLYEGFGLPILGAFHHKVPVACSDVTVFHETAGPAAEFFDPLDEKSIASSISSAIKNKEKLIKLGTTRLTKFSWLQTATETMKVYNSLI